MFSIVGADSRRILKYDAGGILMVRSAGREDRVHELVVGRVFGDLFADPFAERYGSLGAEKLAIHLQQVRPLVGPVVDVLLAADEPVDHLVALDAHLARVGQKFSVRRPPSAASRSDRDRRAARTRRRSHSSDG